MATLLLVVSALVSGDAPLGRLSAPAEAERFGVSLLLEPTQLLVGAAGSRGVLAYAPEDLLSGIQARPLWQWPALDPTAEHYLWPLSEQADALLISAGTQLAWRSTETGEGATYTVAHPIDTLVAFDDADGTHTLILAGIAEQAPWLERLVLTSEGWRSELWTAPSLTALAPAQTISRLSLMADRDALYLGLPELGEVRRQDLSAPERLGLYRDSAPGFGEALLGWDSDGDGQDETLIAADTALFAYSGDGTALWRLRFADLGLAGEPGAVTLHDLGDLDGDGFDDLGVGLTNGLLILPGSAIDEPMRARWLPSDGAPSASGVVSGDLDGNGLPELLIGAPQAQGGAVYLYSDSQLAALREWLLPAGNDLGGFPGDMLLEETTLIEPSPVPVTATDNLAADPVPEATPNAADSPIQHSDADGLPDAWDSTPTVTNPNACETTVTRLDNRRYGAGEEISCRPATRLEAGTAVLVDNGARVVYIAPRILLKRGFRVAAGARFRAVAFGGPLVAHATAAPGQGPAPLSVLLTCQPSDGARPYVCGWDLDGDGSADAYAGSLTHVFDTIGTQAVGVKVTDGIGLTATTNLSVTVEEPVAETLKASARATPGRGHAPLEVQLRCTVSGGAAPYSCLWDLDDDGHSDVSGTSIVHSFTAPGTYAVRLIATDAKNITSSATLSVIVDSDSEGSPEDPPMLDPTVATTTHVATQFLYTGSNPVQTGVAPGTIEAKQAAVIRGRLLDKTNAPLPGVTISIKDHPEFGQTLSRADGWFDLAVNGGGLLTIDYARAGYLPAQRQVDVPWQDFAIVDDVVLVVRDAKVTRIDLTDTTEMQVAQGSVITDDDGTRQATLLIPAGTQASRFLEDGSTEPLSTLTLSITEYTVGANGPQSMPAPLPPTSGYTYAVDIGVEEAAVRKDGQDVVFDQPVPYYVDNFLGFPVGEEVPAGYYDTTKAAWIAEDNGRVIQILAISGGLADLDLDGSGQAADAIALAVLGITDAERQRLATLYTAGKTLWRVPLTHLSWWDLNWLFGPPGDAEEPPSVKEPPEPPSNCTTCPCPGSENQQPGSIIGCESQTLGEQVPLVGSGVSLNYRSDRVPGRLSARTLDIQLSGDSVPASLKRIEAFVTVAGVRYDLGEFSTQPNQTTTFNWNGKNAYGQTLQGSQAATISVGYVYDGTYEKTDRFGYNGNGVPISGDPSRQEITLWQETYTSIGTIDMRQMGVAGWSLDVHHGYDPLGRTLYLGSGDRRVIDSLSTAIESLATSPLNCDGLAVAPNGALYVAGGDTVVRVDSDNSVTTVAGGSTLGVPAFGYLGEGGPATEARLWDVSDVAVGSDGTVYLSATNHHRVLRVGSDGLIWTVAGTGVSSFSGDGGLAKNAEISSPTGIAVTPDGSLLIADAGNARIRRVGPDGRIYTVAGTGTVGYTGDGGPAKEAQIGMPYGVDVGPDGSIYIAERLRIRKVSPNGIITTVAGNGRRYYRDSDDGGLATDAGMELSDVAVAPDGGFYIADNWDQRILYVNPDGIITSIAGIGGVVGYTGDGGPATAAKFTYPGAAVVTPDGSLVIADGGNKRLRRIRVPAPAYDGAPISIASEDGAQLYLFDANGRHLRTVDTLTKAVLYSFGYDANGRLISMTDAFGNVAAIERDADGNPTAFIAPFGQRTTLSLDTNGYLAAATNPAGEDFRMVYTEDGLLSLFTDPNGQAAQFTYDALGRLERDENAAGGTQALSRQESDTGYVVTRATGENRVTTYAVDNLSTGARERLLTKPDGTETLTLLETDGSASVTEADGTSIQYKFGPDPRFDFIAPVLSNVAVTTGGLTATQTRARSATLTDATDPLSLSTLTDVSTVNGRASSVVYDASARTTTSTSAAGRVTTQELDALGRPVSIQVAGILPVEMRYDAQGRLSALAQGAGAGARTLAYAYDADGYLANLTDALGRQVQFDYDLAGRVTTQTLPDGREILYRYDAKGNLASLTPPGQPAHVFRYTSVDQTEEYIPPDVGAGTNSTVYTYDLDKNLTSVARPDGQTLTIDYDAAGRLSSLELQPAGQRLATYGYRATTGKLTEITTPDAELIYSYSGALLTQTQWTGEVNGRVGFGYDTDFRISSITLDGADTIAYGYDADSLLIQAGDLTLTRDAQHGLLTGTALGSVSDRYAYDDFGGLAGYSAESGAGSLIEISYTRDKLGRITQKRETRGALEQVYDYRYDRAGRLVEVKKDSVVQSTYTYDDNGNRLSRSTPSGTETGTYDAQDRLLTYDGVSYSYTANGEMASKDDNGQVTQYDYDVLGNLKQVVLPGGTVIDYLTDGQNRRIGKKVNGVLVQGFLWQERLRPIAELDGSGNIVSRFVYGDGVNVPDYMVRGGSTYRIVKDHLGSPRFVVDVATNTVAQEMAYDEFGNVLTDTNPGFQPFGFAGGLYDIDTGLVRFGARDYASIPGRWESKDPIGFSGLSANLIGYVSNDPINYIDPNGKCPGDDPDGCEQYCRSIGIGKAAEKIAPLVGGGPGPKVGKVIGIGLGVGEKLLPDEASPVGGGSGIITPGAGFLTTAMKIDEAFGGPTSKCDCSR
ncbi:hypothetical protein CKO23_07295 [Thiocystis violacea]|nr:hypothetical protein [Thiocystis violacea]